jgi:RNA polymerase sigma factor (sigma-70 family)
MTKKRESDFAEISVERRLLESFANEDSPYYRNISDREKEKWLDHHRSRLRWHIARSLSRRQKEVINLFLSGKKQSEIASILGIKQQVVSIYKKRAINKLRILIGQ